MSTNPPRDASEIANEICGCATKEQHKRDIALIEADRNAVRDAALAESEETIRKLLIELNQHKDALAQVRGHRDED